MRNATVLICLLAGCSTAPKPEAAAPAPEAIRPFRIQVPDATLTDLRERLARTRFPDAVEGAGWDYGVDLAWVKELVEYWRTKYDWREQERRLNAFDQFVTTIDGLDLHFIHQRSKHPNAMPLVLLHGWPGSIVEFIKVIGPLTDPTAHGGRAEDAFHVVAPSLPGFGFSGRPTERGWSVSRMSDTIAKLMERLGYTRYAAQGGDWGSNIAGWLGSFDSSHVAGIHITFLGGGVPQGDNPFDGVTAAEKERFEKRRAELQSHGAYAAIQGSRPQTLGFGLNDSPAGLAAWITDKFWAWSDHGGRLENSFSKDDLLTNVMVYWVTQTAASSARIYFERQAYTGGRKSGRVPVGVALFPKEIGVPPRKWIQARMNLTHWTEMPRGGHFAALEAPDLLVEDVRAFFRGLR